MATASPGSKAARKASGKAPDAPTVTADQVQELAAELWAAPHHLTVVGPFDADPLEVAP